MSNSRKMRGCFYLFQGTSQENMEIAQGIMSKEPKCSLPHIQVRKNIFN